MNSLTANNRLSQQLVVSVAEHLLLRHECRLPNLLAVSNHRELYLTVGGELCRNLTAGFVTEEDFMFMLFVGSQKHSALSIFAKTTRMSALVLCGNSSVILLSVKDHQHIDSAIPGRYTVQAPYKAGAGIGVLELIKAIYDDHRLRQPRSVHHQRNWRFRWWKYFTDQGGCHHGYCPSPHSSE